MSLVTLLTSDWFQTKELCTDIKNKEFEPFEYLIRLKEVKYILTVGVKFVNIIRVIKNERVSDV